MNEVTIANLGPTESSNHISRNILRRRRTNNDMDNIRSNFVFQTRNNLNSMNILNQLMSRMNNVRGDIQNSLTVDRGNFSLLNLGISTRNINTNGLNLHNINLNPGSSNDLASILRRIPNDRSHILSRDLIHSSSDNLGEDDNELNSISSDSSLSGSERFNLMRNSSSNFINPNNMRQFFQMDSYTNLRMNPMNLNDPNNSINSIFRSRSNFMDYQTIWDRNRITQTESDSDGFIRDEENFELLNEDEYSSGSDQNDDPIGVNMNEMMMEQEEDEEPDENEYNQFENPNFNQENEEEERSYFSINEFETDPLNEPIREIEEEIDEIQDSERNIQNQIDMGNLDRLSNYLHENPNENIMIERIEEEQNPEIDNIDPELIEDVEIEEDSGYSDNEMIENSDSYYYFDDDDISHDFEEEMEGREISVESENIHDEYGELSELIDEDEYEYSSNELNPSVISIDEEQIFRQIKNQTEEIDFQIKQDLRENNSFMMSKKNNSNEPIEEEDFSKIGGIDSHPDLNIMNNSIEFTKLKEKSCINILNKYLSPLTQSNFMIYVSVLKKSKKPIIRPIIKKNLFNFDICSDVWSDLYHDILSEECRPKFENYPFKFPRTLYYEPIHTQGDFGSKTSTIHLYQQLNHYKDFLRSNVPIIFSKNMMNQKKSTQIKMIFHDIKNIGFNLRPENLIWKKNFEEFCGIGMDDWNGKKLSNQMEKDHFRIVKLRKAKDLYNYASTKKCGKEIGKKHFKFNKEIYWISDNGKESCQQKLSIIDFNNFPVNAFNFISEMGDFVRNNSKKYENNLFKLKQNEESSSFYNFSSIYELSKECKGSSSNNFITTHIDKKDKWFEKLKHQEDFKEVLLIESDVFNDTLKEISQHLNFNSKEIEQNQIEINDSLFREEFYKVSEDKKKHFKKKILEFIKENLHYFDLTKFVDDPKYEFLFEKPNNNKKPESSLNNSNEFKKFPKFSKYKILKAEPLKEVKASDPDENIYETPRNRESNRNMNMNINLDMNERNNSFLGLRPGRNLPDHDFHFEGQINQSLNELRNSRRLLRPAFFDDNQNEDFDFNLGNNLSRMYSINNYSQNNNNEPMQSSERDQTNGQNNFENNNQENILNVNLNVEATFNDNNSNQNEENNEILPDEEIPNNQNNNNMNNNVMNFSEIGLPNNILESRDFSEDVFRTVPFEVQLSVLSSYAEDLGINVSRERITDFLNRFQNNQENNIPNVESPAVIPEPLLAQTEIIDENQNDNSMQNQDSNIDVNQNNANNIVENQNNQNQIIEENQNEENNIVEENANEPNPNNIVEELTIQNNTVNEPRHFLYDLDQGLRRTILLEMPALEINSLPPDLQEEARNLQSQTNQNNLDNNHNPMVINLNTSYIANPNMNNHIHIENSRLPLNIQRFIVNTDQENPNRNRERQNDDEYEKIEMEYNGINKVKKIINENLSNLDKVKKGNQERNMYLKLHENNKFKEIKKISDEFKQFLFKTIGYMSISGCQRAIFSYLINLEMNEAFSKNSMSLIREFITFLEKKYSEQIKKNSFYKIDPTEKFYLKNCLSMLMESTKSHNIFFVKNPDSLSEIFESIKKISQINEEIIIQRVLPLPLHIIKCLIKNKPVKKNDLFFKQDETFFLDFKITNFDIETILSLINSNLKFYNQRDIINSCFIQIELLLLNPDNWNSIIDSLSVFLNSFCENINSKFEEIIELSFEKDFRDRHVKEGKSKNKKKMILKLKKISPSIENKLKNKIEKLKFSIQNLQKIFEKVEGLFIKIVKYCFQNRRIDESAKKHIIQFCIVYLENKISNSETSFVKYKDFMLTLQKKFIEEEVQHFYLRFAQILEKKNINFMFKNLFLVFKIFEENFESFVTKKTRMSFPIFYKLEPLLETFLIFYRMICNEEVKDFFKQSFTKLILNNRKDFKTLYLKYKSKVMKTRNNSEREQLLESLEEKSIQFLKNESMNLSEENGVSFDESNDIDLFKKKAKVIKMSEYQLNFNHPQNKINQNFNKKNDLKKMKQKFEGTKNLNTSEISSQHQGDNSHDKNEISYMMQKGESNSFLKKLEDKKMKRDQKLSELKENFDKLFRSGVNMNKKVINHFIDSKQKIWTSSFHIIVKNLPNLINFKNKRKYFKQFIHLINNKKIQKIPVERSNLLNSSFNQIQSKNREFFRGKWVIQFSGEEGEDAGGVSREYFLKLSKELLRAEYNFFVPASHGYAFHPSPTYQISGVDPNIYEFAGKIVGKALFEGYYLDAHFTRAFYKQMIQYPLNFNDFEDYDPEYYKNLKWVIENNPDILGLTFSVEEDNFGQTQIFELKKNGAQIEVNNQNKAEYVDLLIKHKLSDRVQVQVERFLKGLNYVIPRNLLKIFNPKEIELLISGLPEININDLQKHTEYTGYHRDSQIIKWFWKTLRSFNTNLKAGFLQFVTGTSKVPLEGFEFLKGMGGNVQKFQIHRSYNNKNLPTSHTCMNQLDLPEYLSEEELKEKLVKAIEFGKEGFGFV